MGFYAPTDHQLAGEYLEHYLAEKAADAGEFSDPLLSPESKCGEITLDARARARELVRRVVLAAAEDEEAFDAFFGEFVTRPRRGVPQFAGLGDVDGGEEESALEREVRAEAAAALDAIAASAPDAPHLARAGKWSYVRGGGGGGGGGGAAGVPKLYVDGVLVDTDATIATAGVDMQEALASLADRRALGPKVLAKHLRSKEYGDEFKAFLTACVVEGQLELRDGRVDGTD